MRGSLRGGRGERRYRLHRLVWTVLREEHRADEAQQHVLGRRLIQWFTQNRKDPANLAAYESEIDHLHEWEKIVVSNGWIDEQVRCLWLQGYPPFHRGQYRVAHDWVKRALDLHRGKRLPDEELEANLLDDYAASLMAAGGDLNEALHKATEALEIRRRVLGEEHPDTATSWSNVGGAYGALGRYGKALEYSQRALEIRCRVLGEEHPATATSWSNVGRAYADLRQYSKALEYAQRALEIRRHVLGGMHPDTLRSILNCVISLNNLGKGLQAADLLQKALARLPKGNPMYKHLQQGLHSLNLPGVRAQSKKSKKK